MNAEIYVGISVSEYRAAVHGERELTFTCKLCSVRNNDEINDDVTIASSTHVNDEVTSAITDDNDDVINYPISHVNDEVINAISHGNDDVTNSAFTHVNNDVSNVSEDNEVRNDDGPQNVNSINNVPDTSIEETFNRRESFRPDVSISEPVQLHERSLDSEPLPTEVIPDGPLTFELIEKGSQKGSSLLVDSIGYSYTVKERKGNRVRWTCSVRDSNTKCPAAVSQIGSNFKPGQRKHVHAPDPARGFTAKVSKRAKQIGEGDVITSAVDIVNKAKLETRTGQEVGVFRADNVARRVNRKRIELRPQDPKDMSFVLHQDSLPVDFWRDDIEVEGRRHLIFSTNEQLDVLRRSSRWYIDGTFKCVRAPFMMLLTIHAFIRRADCNKQVPLIFAIMSGKSINDYVAVFESVQRMLGINEMQGLVVDFEAAIWRAAKQVFPNIRISGCSFHWGQAVFRKVKNLDSPPCTSRTTPLTHT